MEALVQFHGSQHTAIYLFIYKKELSILIRFSNPLARSCLSLPQVLDFLISFYHSTRPFKNIYSRFSVSGSSDRRRKVSAAHQPPDVAAIQSGVRANSGGREGAGAAPPPTQAGAGSSDFFRPRAGSDSRAPSVLGKMASMTRTRWRSGEGQALQQGVTLVFLFDDLFVFVFCYTTAFVYFPV